MPDVDGDVLEAVLEVLRDHQGPEDPITSGEIADEAGIDDRSRNPKTREAIRVLSEERYVPIAGTPNGYFLMTEPAHLEAYLANLDSRIAGIQKRKQTATKAWNRYKYQRDGDGELERAYGVELDEDGGDVDAGDGDSREVTAGD